MKRVRIKKAYRAYRKGEAVEVSDDLAALLVGQGIAEIDRQEELARPRTVEASVLAREVRRATSTDR
jgi:hypothetical protein